MSGERKMNYFEIIVNGDEVISRPYTDAEIAQRKKEENDFNAKLNAIAQADADRKAIFDKLGITEDEAKLLLGGN
jgi:3-methyladenine DNA glycosylase/8-oxoguanine DNA glycosylase